MTARTATKPADDEVFDFNLNTVEAESELRPFRFLWGKNNRRFTMQHLEGIDVWPLMAAAEGGDVHAMTGIFQTALGEDWTDFRATPLPQYKMKALFDAYRKHCGLAEGE